MSQKMAVFLALFSVVFFSDCAGLRKAKAGKVLQSCEFSLGHWSLGSVELDSMLFPKSGKNSVKPFPNPQIMGLAQDLLKGKTTKNIGTAWIQVDLKIHSSSQDSIWIRSFSGKMSMDSLIEATWKADSMVWIRPGENSIPMTIRLPMDARLFQIMTTDSIRLEGGVMARLEPDGADIPLSFDQKRPNPKENIANFLKNAKSRILDALLNSWAKSIQPVSAASP